ncbi:uncharacterized protein FA14DRAFT_117270 [Meira miltonrushii]|uniref:Uncharacterized protein n=1 Tax=Meira miltonrushii TaxID=1280837 RepID=A0A316VKR1_9BASI|nr:uncharacterized protein FA14DRAFT_117270 [Meira miltonrushii]PWN37844.1 hypothetical protein FA14DRAFT_117270 [Meira miltonrushii]
MEATFNDKQVPPSQDDQRRLDNAVRAEKGEEQVGGEAGRQQVGSKDPSEFDNTTGGPGSKGNQPVQDPTI